MVCKKCGSNLDGDSIFCKICGTPTELKTTKEIDEQKKELSPEEIEKRKSKYTLLYQLAATGFVILVIVVILIVSKCGGRLNGRNITYENYQKIQIGMTYEQVKEILGGDCDEKELPHVSCTWSKNLYDKITITFIDNKVTEKSQTGLDKTVANQKFIIILLKNPALSRIFVYQVFSP